MSSRYTVVGISGSLRKASTNTGLLRYAQKIAPKTMTIEIAEIGDIPLLNADVEARERPASVLRFYDQVAKADAVLLACPEYNYCVAPALKNALDWISRMHDNAALAGKPAAIMGAAGGMGSSRAQYQLRQMCVYLNLLPLSRPEFFSNAFSDAFDASGDLVSTDLQQQMSGLLAALHDWIEKIK